MGTGRRKSGGSSGGRDLPRRRLIRRVLIGWIILTLITGTFYAANKARARRTRSQSHSKKVQ